MRLQGMNVLSIDSIMEVGKGKLGRCLAEPCCGRRYKLLPGIVGRDRSAEYLIDRRQHLDDTQGELIMWWPFTSQSFFVYPCRVSSGTPYLSNRVW